MFKCVCGGYVAPLGWVGSGRGQEGVEEKKGKVGAGEGELEGWGRKVIGDTLHSKKFC